MACPGGMVSERTEVNGNVRFSAARFESEQFGRLERLSDSGRDEHHRLTDGDDLGLRWSLHDSTIDHVRILCNTVAYSATRVVDPLIEPRSS